MERYKSLREICSSLGVSRRAVQGYEKAGLVRATGRNKYGHLLYDEAAEQRIAQVKLYQQMGFSIKEIAELIDAPVSQRRSVLEKQLVILRKQCAETEWIIHKTEEMICALH